MGLKELEADTLPVIQAEAEVVMWRWLLASVLNLEFGIWAFDLQLRSERKPMSSKINAPQRRCISQKIAMHRRLEVARITIFILVLSHDPS